MNGQNDQSKGSLMQHLLSSIVTHGVSNAFASDVSLIVLLMFVGASLCIATACVKKG